MAGSGKRIMEDFESLPDTEKQEVHSKLLRSSRRIDHSEVSDDDLVAAADAVLLSYDETEEIGESQ
jgi:hypothetical protein